MKNRQRVYQPIKFICLTFLITWICILFSNYQHIFSYSTVLGRIILPCIDFIESAAPLIVCVLLIRRFFSKKDFLTFFLGSSFHWEPCLIIVGVFVYQFLTFYLFKTDSISGNTLNPLAFLPIWFSQIMLGGGLEEAGWRGYLQPALEERFHTVLSTLFVGMIWSFWHLPYFLIQGNSHTEGNFIFYSITAIATAYTLTALYKLSNSVLICTLFHGWQNAIVMTVPANMGNVGFIGMFVVQIIFSVFLCVYLTKRGKFER